MIRGEEGAALLEAIIALTILATAGSATAALVGQVSDSIERAHRREEEVRSANELLEAVSLWPREDLDRRFGSRRQGEFLLTIGRTGSTLYEVVISDTLGSELLQTSLFRPELEEGM